MTEEINYQALYEQVQRELEAARLTILSMKQARNPLDYINAASVRAFVNRNYVVIVVAIMLLSLLISFLKTFKGIRRNQ